MGHQGHRLAVGWGGVSFCVSLPAVGRFRPCGACPRPCLRSVRQSETGQNVRPSPVPCVGLSPCKWTTILYRAGKWLYGLEMGLCGAIVKPSACVPCQEREKGRKIRISCLSPSLTCSACPVLCICRPLSLGLSCSVTVTDRDKKSGPVFGSLSWCGVLFLLSI